MCKLTQILTDILTYDDVSAHALWMATLLGNVCVWSPGQPGLQALTEGYEDRKDRRIGRIGGVL